MFKAIYARKSSSHFIVRNFPAKCYKVERGNAIVRYLSLLRISLFQKCFSKCVAIKIAVF